SIDLARPVTELPTGGAAGTGTPGTGTPAAGGPSEGGPGAGLAEGLAMYASGGTLVVIADGRGDIGAPGSGVCPVALTAPLVLVSLIGGSYPAEVLAHQPRFAVIMLSAGQRALAGRFAAAGRPGARLLLDGTPHRRGEHSGALIPGGGLAALECEV